MNLDLLPLKSCMRVYRECVCVRVYVYLWCVTAAAASAIANSFWLPRVVNNCEFCSNVVCRAQPSMCKCVCVFEAFNCVCMNVHVYVAMAMSGLPYVPSTYICMCLCTYVCTYTYLHIMSSRLADMTALYAPMYISVSVSCLGGAFLTSNSNNAPPTTAECMSICQCLWVLLYLSPFRCLPLYVCVSDAECKHMLRTPLTLSWSLQVWSAKYTHTHANCHVSPAYTHTQTLEIAKFTCVCVAVVMGLG